MKAAHLFNWLILLVCAISVNSLENALIRDPASSKSQHPPLDGVAGTNYSDLYDQAPRLVLNEHNTLRNKHGVPMLQLSRELNKLSKEWAVHLSEKRELHHRPFTLYGENLYSEVYTRRDSLGYPTEFVRRWYWEKNLYDDRMHFSELYKISNFTQLIWKNTKYLGVGIATNEFEEVYLVCMYEPAGNIVQEFKENVNIKPIDERGHNRCSRNRSAIFQKTMIFASVSFLIYHYKSYPFIFCLFVLVL